MVKSRNKSAVKQSMQKPSLLNFVNLSPTSCPKLYPFLKQNISLSKFLFFPQLLSSGTILTITLEMSEALVLLKTTSRKLSGQPPIMFLIVNIIEESNLLQDYMLALVICVKLYLNLHKFKDSFQDTLNPICSWGFDVELTSHYILHCPNYKDERQDISSWAL